MRKNHVRYAVLCACILAIGLSVVGCKTPVEPPTPPQITVTLDRTAVELAPGDTTTLTASVTGTDAAVAWQTSDKSIVMVDSGFVTALRGGTATITAAVGEAQASCVVTVTDSTVPIVSFGRDKVELCVGGDPFPLTATVLYDGQTVESPVEWQSLDTAVVTVLNGVLTPVAEGQTTVKACTTYLGKYAESTLTVKVVSTSRVTLSADTVALSTYATATQQTSADITAELTVDGETVADATFSAAVTAGAAVTVSVSGAVVTISAVAEGAATVTVTGTKDDTALTAEIEVTVTRGVVTLERKYTVDILAGDVALDFSAYDWGEDVLGIYHDETKISLESQANVLSGDWLREQQAAGQKTVTARLAAYDVRLTLSFIDEYRTVTLQTMGEYGMTAALSPVTGGEGIAGFTAADRVQTYNSGASTGWYTVVEATSGGMRGDFETQDRWVFDIVFADDIAADADGNLGLVFSGAHHIIQIKANGVAVCEDDAFAGGTKYDTCCLTVYDADGAPLTGEIEKNVRYTVAIDLSHNNTGYCLFGLYQADATVYIGNMTACSDAYYQEHIAVTHVRLDQTSVTRFVGAQSRLQATVTNGKGQTVVWTSSDSTVADVDQNGVVTARKAGTATVTATVGQASASCEFRIEDQVEMTLDKTALLLHANDTAQLTATVLCNGQPVTPTSIVWASDHTTFVSVDGGTVTAVAVGAATVTVTATYADITVTKTCTVRVVEPIRVALRSETDEVTQLDLGTYAIGGKYTAAALTAQLIDNDDLLTGALFSAQVTAGEAVAVAVEGDRVTVTAVRAGTATVTVTATYNGTSLSTTLAVEVERSVIETADTVTVGKFDPTRTLLFGNADWAKQVTALYAGDTKISCDGKPAVLTKAWLTQQTGDVTVTAVRDDAYDVRFTVRIADETQARIFMPGTYSDMTTCTLNHTPSSVPPVFTSDDTVTEWTLTDNAWTSRCGFGSMAEYAYWSFEMYLPSILTDNLILWLAGNHVVQVDPNGVVYMSEAGGYGKDHVMDNCVTIFDADGNIHYGPLAAKTLYWVDVHLDGHRGNASDIIYEMTFGQAFTVYFANSFTCSENYYNTVIKPRRNRNTDLPGVAVTKSLARTYTLAVDALDLDGDMIGVYLGETLISAENTVTLLKEWVNAANAGNYLVTIHTTTQTKSVLLTVHSVNRIQYASYVGGATVSDLQEGSAGQPFGADDTYQNYRATDANGWNNSLTAGNLDGYDWWIFDIVYETMPEKEETLALLWVRLDHVISIKKDGTVPQNGQTGHCGCCNLYNADGSAVDRPLQTGVKYTVEIHMTEGHIGWQAYYLLGFDTADGTAMPTLQIGNSFACHDGYYQKCIAPGHSA